VWHLGSAGQRDAAGDRIECRVADASLAKKLEAHKEKLARGVEEKSKKLHSAMEE